MYSDGGDRLLKLPVVSIHRSNNYRSKTRKHAPVFPTDPDIYCSIYFVNVKLGISISFELGVLTWDPL